MKSKDNDLNLIFLNTPISDKCQDVIGVGKYVEKLNSAIDAGAQMIAVTSPFGSGKSSISKLLEQKRVDKKREKFIKISMWTQFHGDSKNCSTTDLHRDFVYQLSSQIDNKRGSYINRRLSPNYSLLKLHANKKRYWVMILFVIILLTLSWSIKKFPDQTILLFPKLEKNIDNWVTFFSFVGVVLGAIVITKAEIIFSTKKTRGKREIESSEIIDLYRDEILKHKGIVKRKRYLVIIEDLDRTSDSKAVVGFLKELRKYYVHDTKASNTATSYRNKVVFIVNVKPEALLIDQKSEHVKESDINTDKDSLYAKLFDYVLNLQTINIDNYDAILEGLLQEKKEAIKKNGFSIEGNLSELPGMQWIIRDKGHGIGIREIKERLNIAFSLYESLKDRFQGSINIRDFDKCAVVAYLTTAFEHDFYNTNDQAFQKLVNLYLQNDLSEENVSNHLKSASSGYIDTVKDLIAAKLIDNSYRTYFYNYPKGSYLYSSDESQIIKAILYAESVDNLEQVAHRVVTTKSLAPQRAFQTIEKLGLNLPKTIFQSETLYIEALKQSSEKVFQHFEKMDYSSESVAKTVAFFKQILSYDRPRSIYNSNLADKLCKIWEIHYSESALLQLRAMLCMEFSSEIIWYKPLFFGTHALIKMEEMDSCSLSDSITLVNLDNEDFDNSIAEYIQTRFSQQDTISTELSRKVEEFLRSASEYLEAQLFVPLYLGYMDKVSRIVTDFEKETYDLIMNKDISSEVQDTIFNLYQVIINKTSESLSKKTIANISTMNRYKGYNYRVAVQLEESGLYLSYTLLLSQQNRPIPFEREEIKEALEDDIEWFINIKEYFLAIRSELVKCKKDILLQYLFMFDSDCPVLTGDELDTIQSNIDESEQTIMKLVPADLVTLDNYEMLADYFNRKKHTYNMSFEILKYVATFSAEISKLCFYALDFNMVRYKYIAEIKKNIIKQLFSDKLMLDSPSEKIKYMKATKHLDYAWELDLLESLKSNKDLENEYIEVVNNSERLSKKTIETVSKLGTIHKMSHLVNQAFFDNNMFTEYVVSETLGNSRFDLPDNELRKKLWPTYIKIFSSGKYPTTRKYMSKNYQFVNMIMKEKSYLGFEEDNRMQLNGVYQDNDSILNVMEYGTEFALRYYSSMRGFIDESSATTFIKQVEGNPKLIASDILYNNTYNKLDNRNLKARYTNIRTKNGYRRLK